jgi:hypothetical protein
VSGMSVMGHGKDRGEQESGVGGYTYSQHKEEEKTSSFVINLL